MTTTLEDTVSSPLAEPTIVSTPREKALAWGAHAFTLTGVLWAILAAIALSEGRILDMWLWLGIALIVDAVDGSIARAVRVRDHAPSFDGTALDLVVDYLTWTFLPAIFMYTHIPLGTKPLAIATVALICISSMFCYCNVAMKTPDHYFMGFPAAWNVVAVIMWIFQTGSVFNIAASVILSILTLAPITFVHPFRVGRLRLFNILAALTWVATTAALTALVPIRPLWLTTLWWICGLWILTVSAIRTIQGLPPELRRRDTAAPSDCSE